MSHDMRQSLMSSLHLSSYFSASISTALSCAPLGQKILLLWICSGWRPVSPYQRVPSYRISFPPFWSAVCLCHHVCRPFMSSAYQSHSLLLPAWLHFLSLLTGLPVLLYCAISVIVLIPCYHKNIQGVLQTHSFRLSLAVVSFIIFPGYWLCSVFWLIPHLGFLTSSPSAVMKSREPLPIPQVV